MTASLFNPSTELTQAKPFVKWAGGKGQLLREIRKVYPSGLGIKYRKYAEPFVGGGAVLFDVISRYDFDEIYISDINCELIQTYTSIRDSVDELVESLAIMQNEYLSLTTEDRSSYYYEKRQQFNIKKDQEVPISACEIASLFIFLNKTCFNGLYRVNKKGQFNVPTGKYKNPKICDTANLNIVSRKLKNATIVCGDYRKSADFIDENTFVYIDPPYRPLTATSSFTAYTEHLFDDDSQKQLAEFISSISEKNVKVIVSNSDPTNIDENDDFFDKLYSRFIINRVTAARMINSVASSRGRINELLISNF
jgi:DNA adenine methylase